MELKGNCLTTAMGILPHSVIAEAVKLALSLDIPFWPQLPHYSFYEDMYVQISEHFPGIFIDEREKRVQLDVGAFYEGLFDYAQKSESDDFFKLSPRYSAALDAFLAEDLAGYPAVRGQTIGPVSFGLKITDREMKPIIYNEDVKSFLFDFIARKVNVQFRQLRAKNPNAFVWVDEPGLEILFGSFTGYPSSRAKEDFREFVNNLDGPRGVHLCGNPDWSFLLTGLNLNIVSIDVFGWGHIFTRYHEEIKDFLAAGNIISWGVIPTLTEELDKEDIDTLLAHLESLWDYLAGRGIDKKMILSRAWLAPARCCLINADGIATVEKAFILLREISRRLRSKYGLE